MAAQSSNSAISKTIQQDWANREYIEIITGSIKKISDFLNSFDRSCRGRLAELNEKLTSLERSIEHYEAKTMKNEYLAANQSNNYESNQINSTGHSPNPNTLINKN
ncbi:Eukaryotic translation initiation factor 3 [Sarcoptes scabiei]|uniref:BRICK1-like protein n=1 Tax=Sarcoptes scabiei TaxID=52283 RepID=A0A132AA10_SARSC|nr:hypothetical protein QR98_0062180 [Sarcoptes scabiei]UXI19869.1 Eukaryotic translation initiation factor 3 [Sarcoptes scabiei]